VGSEDASGCSANADVDAHRAAWAERAAVACSEAARALREAAVELEALAELVPERRRLGIFRRPATMRKLGGAWRLGVLLLGDDADEISLYAMGRTTRAAERGRAGYQSRSLEDRRDLAAAALRGGYPPGTPVNFDARRLPLDGSALGRLCPELPIDLHAAASDDETRLEVRVRWRPGAALDDAPTLERYLTERVALLVDPPLRST